MLRVSLLGNMGAEPEVRYSTKGTQIVQFRVAVNQVRTGPDGERQENTEWFRIKVTGRQGEFVQKLGKGTRVLVFGRLDINRYQNRDGELRTGYDVWADDVQALSARQYVAGETDGSDAEAEGPDSAVAGVSSLSGSRGGNGRDARSSSSNGGAKSEELEDLPF